MAFQLGDGSTGGGGWPGRRPRVVQRAGSPAAVSVAPATSAKPPTSLRSTGRPGDAVTAHRLLDLAVGQHGERPLAKTRRLGV